MSAGRNATTLVGPRRCPYCGHRCHGRTCGQHEDLERAERALWGLPKADRLPTMRDDLRQAVKPTASKPQGFRATCPNPRCGELAKPGRKRCALCRTALYPAESFLAELRAGKYSAAVQPTKGTEA